jgi:hypothetical protein
LDITVGDQGRRHDGSPAVGWQLVFRVVLHLDTDAVALGDDGGDLADLDAHDAEVGSRVDGDGPVEMRGDRPFVVAAEDEPTEDDERDDLDQRDGLHFAGGQHHEPSAGRNSPVKTLSMFGTNASNHGPVPMTLPRMFTYGP